MNDKAKIYYHDIGDSLYRDEKLKIIKDFGNIENIPWQILSPNEHGDWINHRNDIFDTFIPLAPEKKYVKTGESYFIAQSNGLATSRDIFLYGSSKIKMMQIIQSMIDFYNHQSLLFCDKKNVNPDTLIENFVDYDSTKISWSDIFLRDASNGVKYSYIDNYCVGLYRPFFKQWINYDKKLIHRTYQQLRLFPNAELRNIVIIVSGIGASKGFSALMTDVVPNYHTLDTDQCFPLYYYEEIDKQTLNFSDTADEDNYIPHDAISDFILERCRVAYGNRVTKEDIFYYVYGILHSPDYRTRFASDLKKMLPRLPIIDEPKDFWAFSKAGRALAELHLNYETIEPPTNVKVVYTSENDVNYRVEKMRFAKKDNKDIDKTKIIYNHQITIENIPLEAYNYIVNGKSAIEWIMERYAITTHKESGITNNPNDWATEHNDPQYILNLLLSIIHLSTESTEIINKLPKIKFE